MAEPISRLKRIEKYMKEHHAAYISADDKFDSLESTRLSLNMAIDRIADDEHDLLGFGRAHR